MMSPAPPLTVSINSEAYALIRRVAVGDAVAVEALHRQYTSQLRGYLQSRLDYRHLVEG